jgi:hypothetical protein
MIHKNNIRLFYCILNAWLAYVVILVVFYFLPHWGETPVWIWINEALYFLLFLFSLSIALNDGNNRDIFINMAVFLFFLSFSFLNNYIGDAYPFGNDDMMYHVYVLKKLIFGLLLNLTVVYIVLKHLFLRAKPLGLYLGAFGLSAAVLVLHFFNYIVHPHYIRVLGDNYIADLFRRIFLNDSASLVFLLFFGYGLYRKDVTLGEYINSLMSFLFVFCMIDLTTILGTIYHFDIPSISHYFLVISQVLLLIVLSKRLRFLHTEYGQFYENLLNGRVAMGPQIRIERRRSKWNALTVKALRFYLAQRYHYFISFTGIVYVFWMSYHLPKYAILNITVLGLSVLALFFFMNALYKKREKQNHTLTRIARNDS